MDGQQEEAKEDFESKFDKAFNEVTSDSSTGVNEETEATDKTAGAEPEKTDQVKSVEADASLNPEEKIAKIKDILGDDEKAVDAYIKSKGYHNDPAWQKQREQIEKLKAKEASGFLSDEDKSALEDWKKFRNSPEGITQRMKSEGYTQETIDKKLKESGFEVKVKPQDDVNFVVDKLGLKLDEMAPDDKANILANISDISKVFNILFEDRFGKVLPQKIAPIEEHIKNSQQKEAATQSVNSMRETVKTEGILDFEKDIEPVLNKFMDDNPDATQQDVVEHFKDINHQLSTDRLKTGKKKEERDDKRSNLRQNLPLTGGKPALKKNRNFEQAADDFFAQNNIS